MRITRILAILTLIVAIFLPSQSSAQSNRILEQLSQINRIDPLQNPEFDRESKIIDRKIVDRKNKVVGNVQDVVINANGTIASIITDFDRLHLGNNVALNYRTLNIRSRSNGYTLNMDSDEITDFYPQLLSNIETASGSGNTTYSVKKLVGTQLISSDKRKIGRIKNILFSNNGGIARAVFAELSRGTSRGKTVAIPFRYVKLVNQRGRLTGIINADTADAMEQIADD